MSFFKISDPVKRDLNVKEYFETKKNIWDNLLSERTRALQLQTNLSKFFKPITETQKATMREITEGLKPIKEGIENLRQTITFPAYPSIRVVEEPPKALALTVWDKKIFKNYLLYLYVKSENPQMRNNFLSRAIILSILVEGHCMMLNAKYESASPYDLGQDDF